LRAVYGQQDGGWRHLKRLLCGVPHFNVTQILLGASAEIELEGESKAAVDALKKVERSINFRLNLPRLKTNPNSDHLAWHAEDVSIILLEAAHTREARECPRKLVAVEHAKVGQPDRELAIRTDTVAKHQTGH
jgi:hypothetical protein